jgi:hypothetical protein
VPLRAENSYRIKGQDAFDLAIWLKGFESRHNFLLPQGSRLGKDHPPFCPLLERKVNNSYHYILINQG